MGSFSPGALRAQIDAIIEAACDAQMEESGWLRHGDHYASGDFHETIPAGSSAQECAGVYITPSYAVHRPPPGAVRTEDGRQYYVDVATAVVKPWREWAQTTFEGWDEIPLATDFSDLVDAAREAVALLTTDAGSSQTGGDLTADGDLGANLTYIARWISPSSPTAYTGESIGAFDYSYGAARQATVIANQRQAMIAVGLCLAGAQTLWAKAGADIMTFAENAETAFRERSASGFDLGLVSAFLDVVGVFAVGPVASGVEVAEKIVTGAKGANTILSEIQPKDSAEAVDPALSGGSAVEVAENIGEVLKKMRTATWEQEKALIKPLAAVKDDMFGDPSGYHIHPAPGYDPGVGGVPEIKMNSSALNRAMGTAIAVVVAKLTRAARRMEKAGRSDPWWHPVSVGYGTSGASPELQQLTSLISEISLSTCQELLGATRRLAQALGTIDAVDEEIDQALGGLRKELRGHPPRFPGDPGDPRTPQPWFTTPGGKQIPVGP